MNVFHKFKQIGSVSDVKTSFHACIRCSDKNIAAVREIVAEHPDISIHHCAQELNLTTTKLPQILTKYLSLQAYNIQLTQELEPDDHLKRRTFFIRVQEQRQADDDFLQKNRLWW